MMPLVSSAELCARIAASVILPQTDEGKTDEARVESALQSATGVIAAYLPWLLDKGTGEIARPVTPQFADALDAVCIDIAIDRLTDIVTGSENTRNKYKESVALLEKINKEYQGGLEGPGWQTSEIVTPNEAEGIVDRRFFKKGRMF